MPVLIVYGIPENFPKLEKLAEILIDTTAWSIRELNLKTSDVSCFFPKNLLLKGAVKEIVIFVDGLLEGSRDVRYDLARKLVRSTNNFFEINNLSLDKIECIIRPFDLGQGFSSLCKD